MSRVHRFSVGAFQCLAISDGYHSYEPARFFQNAPAETVRSELDRIGATDPLITTPYTFLLVDTGANRVLVDLGAGSMAPTTGRLFAALQEAGFGPQTVDTIVITHAHPDHVGGALDEQGRLRFPESRYFVPKREWEFWFSDQAETAAPPVFAKTARAALEAMESTATLVDSEDEILAGVRLLHAPGHTPGHMVVAFVSGKETLVYAADTVLYPLHLEHPDWTPVYDLLPKEAEASKRRIFDRAAQEDWLVMAQHFPPFPSLGRIQKTGTGWLWKPKTP